MKSKKFMVLFNLIIFLILYYLNIQFALRRKVMIVFKLKKFPKHINQVG